jgi:hypothetical protein
MKRILLAIAGAGIIGVSSCTHSMRTGWHSSIGGEGTTAALERSTGDEPDGKTREAVEVGFDDLGWLVGRWNVVERQADYAHEWDVRHDLSRLEYINVFYPFAPGWPITLSLGVLPNRPITAEFIERRPDGALALVDCMGRDGLVFVGRSTMGIGYPPPRGIGVTYNYWYDEEAMAEMLSLEAEGLILKCRKVSFYPKQDVVEVHASDADWRVANLAYEYAQVKRRMINCCTAARCVRSVGAARW